MANQEPIHKHIVVDNRVFLIGLDKLYRRAMKKHECSELLDCASKVANVLAIDPADVPVEGYYVENKSLTLYFQLMRALQEVEENQRFKVKDLNEFRRLEQVTSSPIFGVRQAESHTLLPKSIDSLGQALISTQPNWKIEILIDKAFEAVHELDDFSLGGLAALAKDAVVLTALRESVALYMHGILGALPPPIIYSFEWQVSDHIAAQAMRFIRAFQELFGDTLPEPNASNAELFWGAAQTSYIIGRCVCLGFENRVSPVKYYHWAIGAGPDGQEVVREFWDDKLWTTEMYRKHQDQKSNRRAF